MYAVDNPLFPVVLTLFLLKAGNRASFPRHYRLFSPSCTRYYARHETDIMFCRMLSVSTDSPKMQIRLTRLVASHNRRAISS